MLALLSAALAAGVWFALLRPGREAASLGTGQDYRLIAPDQRRPVPALSGSALDPPPSELSLRTGDGRPTFIDVWASWCLPCKEEAPMLARLHHRYGREIRFLGIDVEDTRTAAHAFERRYRLRYPSIFDERASMAGKLGFIGLPTAYLVDRRGRIAAMLVGKQSRIAIETRLRHLVDDSKRK